MGKLKNILDPKTLLRTLFVSMAEPSHNRRHPSGGHRAPITPSPGQVSLRLLCRDFAVGGVIGESGSTVSRLQRETATRIQCLERVAGCDERVVAIVGSAAAEKEMLIVNGEDEICEERFEVSSAQEALFRVYETIWGIEGIEARLCCRLLAEVPQVGLLIGKGGRNVKRLKKESGAEVEVLPAPVCAAMDDQVIRLTGGILAVKKALFRVSCCLQACPSFNNTQTLSSSLAENVAFGVSSDPHAEFFPHLASSLPINPLQLDSNDHSFPVDADRAPNAETGSMQQKVEFRLLCSNYQAGGVIGCKGARVRALQNETGAFIEFAPSITGWDERVVTISSFENLEAGYSPAQNAVLRVFAKCIEIDAERGPLSSFNWETTVTARLLVASDHAECLSGNEGRVVSETNNETETVVQVLQGDGFLKFASKNDVIVQIAGEYKSVQTELFQVTGKLRDALLPSEMLSEVRSRSYPFFMTPSISLSGKRMETPFLGFDQQATLEQRMGHRGFSHGLSAPSSMLQPPQVGSRRNIVASNGRGRGLTHPGGGLGVWSNSKHATVQKTTMEITISESIFTSVFSADGSNLEQMKKISGATIELCDPDPTGKNVGTVIISGTPDQALAAQSLLQTFLRQ